MRMLSRLLVVLCLLLAGCSPPVKPTSPPPSPLVGSPVTPAAAIGSVRGKVILQGRMSHEGVTVKVGELAPLVTNPDGGYSVQGMAAPGQYRVVASMPGYLGAQGHVEITDIGETKTLSTITLPAGDLNGDGSIDLFDLVLLGSTFGKQDMASLAADLNTDGVVNLFDLVLVGNNLDRRGPVPLE